MPLVRKQSLALLAALLLFATSLPTRAAQRLIPLQVDAVVYYDDYVTEQTLITRLGIQPQVRYPAGALVQLRPDWAKRP